MKGWLERLRIEGMMPERALLKLKRAEIPLYDIRKLSKTSLELSVRAKDVPKVLSIYPIQKQDFSPFVVTRLGGEGVLRVWNWVRGRIGIVLGAILFCVGSLQAQQYVFAVDIVGSGAYTREVYQALDEQGIRAFALYPKHKENAVCAALIGLTGVEFCSVQKVGMRVRVELRVNANSSHHLQKGDMHASVSGTLVKLTVLRGSAAKKSGEKITAGDTLVYGWFSLEDGGQVSVEPIARASIACVYEDTLQTETQEQAFAEAYLRLRLRNTDYITKQEIKSTDEGYFVRIEYMVIESINL